jgi:hypothetical protein
MTPLLTIALIATGDRQSLERALAVLTPQIHDDVELLVSANRDGLSGDLSRRTIVIAGASVPRMRMEALRAASGDTVALLTDRYDVTPAWVAAVTDGCRDTHPQIRWGPIDHGGPATTAAWARHVAEYGAYMSPVPGGLPRVLPASNIWISRALIPRLLSACPHGTEVEWTRFVRQHHIDVSVAPRAVVLHRHDQGTRAYLSERYHYGRSLAQARLAGATLTERGSHAVRTLLLPIVFFGRWSADVWRRPAHRGRLLTALPLLAAIAGVAAAGELAGSVAARSMRED